MATKPSSILGYNPSRSNCVTVPGGKMTAGFLPGEKPPAQYLGDLFERTDRWLEYIRDGAWTGNTTITGTLGVSGLVTASGGVTAAANQHITVSGTGRFKFGDDAIIISAPMFQSTSTPVDYSSSATPRCTNTGMWTFVLGNGIPIVAGLHLPNGCRIKSIVWHFNKAGSGANLTMSLRERSGGVVNNIDVVVDTSSGATEATQTRTGINYTIATATPVWLEVTASNAIHEFMYAEVTFDRL